MLWECYGKNGNIFLRKNIEIESIPLHITWIYIPKHIKRSINELFNVKKKQKVISLVLLLATKFTYRF